MPTKQPTGAIVDRLRNNSSQDWRWVVPWALFNDSEEHSSREIIEAAADAIEQKPERTCHFEVVFPYKDGVPWYRCSACGVIIPDNSYICIEDGEAMLGTYDECPAFHAKVVDE